MTATESISTHHRLITWLVLRYLWAGDREDLHQIALAAWVAGWEAADPERGEKSRKAYASQAVKNALAREGRRSRAPSRFASLISLDAPISEAHGGTLHDTLPADSRPLPGYDEIHAIRNALALLPPDDRQLLQEVFIDREKPAHLAHRYNVARGTIYNRTTAAVAALKRNYEACLI